MAKAVWVIDECSPRFCRTSPHAWDTAQLSDCGRFLRLSIQLLFDTPHLADERFNLFEQEISPQLLRRRGQSQLAQPGQTLLGHKPGCFGGTMPALRRSA